MYPNIILEINGNNSNTINIIKRVIKETGDW